jgi:hypothetical protein
MKQLNTTVTKDSWKVSKTNLPLANCEISKKSSITERINTIARQLTSVLCVYDYSHGVFLELIFAVHSYKLSNVLPAK